MSWFIGQLLPASVFGWVAMLLQAVAWPATVVVIAAMFRAEVRTLLDRLVHVKIQDVEAQFARDLRESEDLAVHAVGPRRILDYPGETRRVIHELDEQSKPIPVATARSPRAAFEGGWASLALAADRATGTTGIDPSRTLADNGILDGPSLVLLERLRQLHLQVARQDGWEPTADAADRFVNLAQALAAKIGQARPRPI